MEKRFVVLGEGANPIKTRITAFCDFSPYQNILEQEGAKFIDNKFMLGSIMIENNDNPTMERR